MKLVLVYPPFCPPTVPPYSITQLAAFAKANSDMKVQCLDLNARFHRMRFPALYKRLERARDGINPYSEMLEKYSSSAKKVHRKNNEAASAGAEPELFRELLATISEEKPDFVGFSFVYNSQVFYGMALARELARSGIKCVAGGPAADKRVAEAMPVLKGGPELLRHLTGQGCHGESHLLDFSNYRPDDYLSREMIYPMRSSYGCSHRGCAFCTHHGNAPYREIPLDEIEKTVKANRIRNLFFIDDTIPAGRLSGIAKALGPLNVKWWCQTRPTGDLLGLFRELRDGGLRAITFGVESGNQGMLDSMGKGTSVGTVSRVLGESHAAGIRNIVFVMFGFPGETEETASDTMEFLRENRGSIDIVSASVFGLQKGSRVYNHPDRFGVFEIREIGTPLGETVKYKVNSGLGEAQAKMLKERYGPELREMNRLPKIFALLKEQSLLF